MKKIFKITISMFLVSSILQILLNYIINEQILSRLLFGLDYSTYLMNYYQGISGFIGLISDAKMPYEWLFTISKYIIVFCCVILLFFTIKKIGKNNTINKKEFCIIMGLYSLLVLHDVIIYISLYFRIPPMKFFVVPIIFIVSAYVFVYKIIYIDVKTNVWYLILRKIIQIYDYCKVLNKLKYYIRYKF